MTIKFYLHGITDKNLRFMLEGREKPEGPWTCSDRDDFTYLWDVEKVLEDYGDEDIPCAVLRAFESAEIQAACQGIGQPYYALLYKLDDSEVEPDVSCENMDRTAVCMRNKEFSQLMPVQAWQRDFTQLIAPVILANVLQNEYFNINAIQNPLIEKIAKALHGTELREYSLDLIEEILEPTQREIDPEDLWESILFEDK